MKKKGQKVWFPHQVDKTSFLPMEGEVAESGFDEILVLAILPRVVMRTDAPPEVKSVQSRRILAEDQLFLTPVECRAQCAKLLQERKRAFEEQHAKRMEIIAENLRSLEFVS